MEKKFAKFVIGFFVFGLVFFGLAESFLNGRLGVDGTNTAEAASGCKPALTVVATSVGSGNDWYDEMDDKGKAGLFINWGRPALTSCAKKTDKGITFDPSLPEVKNYETFDDRAGFQIFIYKDGKEIDRVYKDFLGEASTYVSKVKEIAWSTPKQKNTYKARVILRWFEGNANYSSENFVSIGGNEVDFTMPVDPPSYKTEAVNGCSVQNLEAKPYADGKDNWYYFIWDAPDKKSCGEQFDKSMTLFITKPNKETELKSEVQKGSGVWVEKNPQKGTYIFTTKSYYGEVLGTATVPVKGMVVDEKSGVAVDSKGNVIKNPAALKETLETSTKEPGSEGPNGECEAPGLWDRLAKPIASALQYTQCIILLGLHQGILKIGEWIGGVLSISYNYLDRTYYSFWEIQNAHASLSSQLNPDETVGDHGNKPMYIFKIWENLRTFIDVFIVFVLIFVALANIFHISIDKYAVKKALPGLVLGVILANFSGFICRMILDAANIVIHWVTFGGEVGELLWKALSALGFTKMVGAIGGIGFLAAVGFVGFASTIALWVFIIAAVFFLVILVAVFIIWVMLAIRVVIIYVLYAISPIAFLSLGSPMTSGAFKRWWAELTNWAFMPVTMFFLLNLAGQLDNSTPESLSLLINNHNIMIGDVGSIMDNIIRPVLIIGLLYGAWIIPLKAKGFFGGVAGFAAGQMLAPGNAARSFIKKEGKDWAGIGADKVKSKVPFLLRGAAIKEKARNQVDSDLRLTKAGAMGQDELFKEENRQRNSHKKDLDEAGVMDPVALADSLEKAQNKLQVEAVMQQALEQKSLKEFIEEVSNRNNPQSLKKLGVENKEVLEEMAQKFGGTETDASGNTRTIHEEREAIQEMAARIHGTTRDAVITDRTKGNELAASRFANSLGSLAKKTGQYGLFRATTAPGEFKSQGDLSKSAIENMRKTNDAEQFVGSLDADWIEIDKDAIFHDDNADDILTVMKTRPGKMKPSAKKKIADLYRSGNLPSGRFRDALDHARDVASEHTTIQRQIESHDNEISNFQRQIEEANTAIAEAEKNMGAGFRMDVSVSDEIKRKKEEIERINRQIEQKQIDKTADIARLNEKTEEVKETEHLRSMGIV